MNKREQNEIGICLIIIPMKMRFIQFKLFSFHLFYLNRLFVYYIRFICAIGFVLNLFCNIDLQTFESIENLLSKYFSYIYELTTRKTVLYKPISYTQKVLYNNEVIYRSLSLIQRNAFNIL